MAGCRSRDGSAPGFLAGVLPVGQLVRAGTLSVPAVRSGQAALRVGTNDGTGPGRAASEISVVPSIRSQYPLYSPQYHRCGSSQCRCSWRRNVPQSRIGRTGNGSRSEAASLSVQAFRAWDFCESSGQGGGLDRAPVQGCGPPTLRGCGTQFAHAAHRLSMFQVSQTGDSDGLPVIQRVAIRRRVPGFVDWRRMCQVSWTDVQAGRVGECRGPCGIDVGKSGPWQRSGSRFRGPSPLIMAAVHESRSCRRRH